MDKQIDIWVVIWNNCLEFGRNGSSVRIFKKKLCLKGEFLRCAGIRQSQILKGNLEGK